MPKKLEIPRRATATAQPRGSWFASPIGRPGGPPRPEVNAAADWPPLEPQDDDDE